MKRPRISLLAIAGLTALTLLQGCRSDRNTMAVMSDDSLPGQGVTIYAAGDIADCRRGRPEQTGAADTAAIIAAGLANDANAAVLALGDNTYPIGLLNEFTDCYGPTWGRFKQRTHPTPGNHEYYSPQAAGYYRYFGEAAGQSQRGYYSTRIGEWHVVSLNSNLKATDHAEQLAWLKDNLAQNRHRCTLAFWHHPRFSSGGHGSNPKMDDVWKTLAQSGADVVLAAHDHDYERFAPLDGDGNPDDKAGMRSFVVGTGGAHLTPMRFPHAHSEASTNSTNGVLRMVLKTTGYEWEFLPVKEGGFQDRGAGLCSAARR